MTELRKRPGRRHRDAMEALARRRNLLADRLADWHGRDNSRTRAELSALNYALRILAAADTEDVLHDLEVVAGLRAS